MTINNNVALENNRPRVDIHQKVTGAAKYTADQYPAKLMYARMIRFPYGKGIVESADLDAARAVPGVLEVELDTSKTYEYQGASMGHVAAESLDAIDDAIAALKLKFDYEKPRVRQRQLFRSVPEPNESEKQKLAPVFEKAAAVVEATYETQVQTHSCLEPHGSVADHRGDSAVIWGSTQGTFAYLDGIKDVCGLPPAKITVHNEYVGGGFGSKFGPDKEGTLAARLSKKYKRPCKAMLDRREEHLDGGCRPGSIQYMRMAVDKNGKILGGRMYMASSVGYREGGGGVANVAGRIYDLGTLVRSDTEITLNSQSPRAFRAPGWPQGVFGVESMMDELAAKIKMDPLEFRKINDVSERRKRQLDRGAELIGWKNRKPDGASPGRIKRGIGVASAMWPTWPTVCSAACDIHRDGTVEVRSGVQDIGTGTFTVVTDVAANELGIDRDLVTGKVGNSEYPRGPGSGGSVVSRSVAPAVRKACADAKEQLIKALASHWKTTPSEVKMVDGNFIFGEKKATWKEACSVISGDKITGNGRTETGAEGSSDGSSDCVQFAEVEVDTETGIVRVVKIVAVHSAGQIVNRKTIENQICGGVAQGISYALFEQRILDRNTGGMLNDGFIDYKIAGPVDIPEIIPVLDATEQDTGVRPIGEPATIPTAGAIANAVANAIGARVRSLPITPAKVLAALEEARKGATA